MKQHQVKIYISGKISGLNWYYAYNRFATANRLLEKQGYKVVNPMCHSKREWSWLRCMAVSLWLLLPCHSVYMLDNWQYSRGARIEYTLARLLRKHIIFEQR